MATVMPNDEFFRINSFFCGGGNLLRYRHSVFPITVELVEYLGEAITSMVGAIGFEPLQDHGGIPYVCPDDSGVPPHEFASLWEIEANQIYAKSTCLFGKHGFFTAIVRSDVPEPVLTDLAIKAQCAGALDFDLAYQWLLQHSDALKWAFFPIEPDLNFGTFISFSEVAEDWREKIFITLESRYQGRAITVGSDNSN